MYVCILMPVDFTKLPRSLQPCFCRTQTYKDLVPLTDHADASLSFLNCMPFPWVVVSTYFPMVQQHLLLHNTTISTTFYLTFTSYIESVAIAHKVTYRMANC